MAEELKPPSSIGLGAEAGEHDDGLSAFAGVRPRLFGIAYRMLGSASEAEDVVQDVWLRWQSSNRKAVEHPPAFLATTTTRICINLAQSAQKRHETYVGTWLPEPVDTSSDPGLGAERSEACSPAASGETFSHRTCRICSTRGVRLLLRPDRIHFANGGSQRPPTRLSCSQTYRRWPSQIRKFKRATAPSRSLCHGRAERRHGRPGRAPRRGCCRLRRRWWTCARGGSPSLWSRTCEDVRRGCLQIYLERREC